MPRCSASRPADTRSPEPDANHARRSIEHASILHPESVAPLTRHYLLGALDAVGPRRLTIHRQIACMLLLACVSCLDTYGTDGTGGTSGNPTGLSAPTTSDDGQGDTSGNSTGWSASTTGVDGQGDTSGNSTGLAASTTSDGSGTTGIGDEMTCKPGEIRWARQIGEDEDDFASGVAVDPHGNPIVIGMFHDAIDLGGGPLSVQGGFGTYLAQFEPEGEHLWSRAFTLNLTGGQQVAAIGQEVFVGGDYWWGSVDFGGGLLPDSSGGIGIAKLAGQDGAHIWSEGFGDEYSKDLRYVAMDGTGAVLFAGSFGGVLDFGGGPISDMSGGSSVFVAKLDDQGNHVFTKLIDDPLDGVVMVGGLAVDGAGNVAIAGIFKQQLILDPNVAPVGSNGSQDIFLAKLTPTGEVLWQKTFGDTLSDGASQVAFDAMGNVYLTGTFLGSVDFGGGALVALGTHARVFVAKFDFAGNHIYSRAFGDSYSVNNDERIAVEPMGSVVMTGTFRGTMDFDGTVYMSEGTLPEPNSPDNEILWGGDVFVAKLGIDGHHLWSHHFGDPDRQSAGGVAISPGGEVFAVGSFRGTVDFRDGPRTTNGGMDGYLVSFCP